MGKILDSIKIFAFSFRMLPHIFLFQRHPEIKKDLIKYTLNGKCNTWAFINTCRLLPFFRNVFYYRVGKRWRQLIMWMLPDAESMHIYGAGSIGEGCHFEHAYWTYFNVSSIGKNFYVLHNVTLGRGKDGIPSVGDNVQIYANAVIFGNVHIGNNVRIGAGCVVNKSVPDNCTVIGNPAIIIKKDNKKVNILLSDYGKIQS